MKKQDFAKRIGRGLIADVNHVTNIAGKEEVSKLSYVDIIDTTIEDVVGMQKIHLNRNAALNLYETLKELYDAGMLVD